MVRTGFAGAQDRIAVLVRDAEFKRRVIRMAAKAPSRARAAMAAAVSWWHAQLVPRLPVSAGRMRGRLKRSTQPVVRSSSGEVRGGIYSGVPYALWLVVGTRRIAGGRVMRWRPGQPLITDWPAKRARIGGARRRATGGGRRARAWGAMVAGASEQALPIIIPWLHDARQQFASRLLGTITKG